MTEYKIYEIKSSQTDKIYIGSTKHTLEKRLSRHEYAYKAWSKLNNNNLPYITSFNIVNWMIMRLN